MAMSLPITGLTAGYFGIAIALLGLRIGFQRNGNRVGYGPLKTKDEKVNKRFEHLVRAHGSTTEYAPIFVLILAGLEANQVLPRSYLLGVALAFIVARTSHTLKLGDPAVFPQIMRLAGFLGQVLLLTAGGGLLMVSCIKALA